MNKYIIILVLLFGKTLYSNDSLNYYKLAGLGIVSAGGFTSSQIIQYDDYWSDRTDFYVMDWDKEYPDALLADKFGHFYFSYGLAKCYSKAVEWTGLNPEASSWIGSGVSLFHQTYVEINDGYSKGEDYLGFSIGDMIANISGAALPLFQYYYKDLEAITFKISFKKHTSFEKHKYEVLTHDYESTYHWLSYNLNSITKNKYLEPLAISLGHSVKDLDRLGAGQHEFYIAIDFNWKYLLKYQIFQNEYLKILIEILDKYRFPLPAFRISPKISPTLR